MPLFPVLLLVLGLGDVLVALHSLGRLARLVEIQLTGVLGAHGNVREQALEIGALALRTGRGVAGPQELLELMAAAPALVFVDRHWVDYTNSQIPNPIPQIPNPIPNREGREGSEDREDCGLERRKLGVERCPRLY